MNIDEPRTFIDTVFERLECDMRCLELLERVRWPNGYLCPRCQSSKGYRMPEYKITQCAHCRYQASATAGTLFHKSKIPLRKWFRAILLFVTDKTGISASRLAEILVLSYKTAHKMLKLLRAATGLTLLVPSIIDTKRAIGEQISTLENQGFPTETRGGNESSEFGGSETPAPREMKAEEKGSVREILIGLEYILGAKSKCRRLAQVRLVQFRPDKSPPSKPLKYIQQLAVDTSSNSNGTELQKDSRKANVEVAAELKPEQGTVVQVRLVDEKLQMSRDRGQLSRSTPSSGTNKERPGKVRLKALPDLSESRLVNLPTISCLVDNGPLDFPHFSLEAQPPKQTRAVLSGLVAHCKSFFLGTYHRTSQKYLQLYLDEFSFRFNTLNFAKALETFVSFCAKTHVLQLCKYIGNNCPAVTSFPQKVPAQVCERTKRYRVAKSKKQCNLSTKHIIHHPDLTKKRTVC